MEGVQRVYLSGIHYAKQRYMPNTFMSVIYILLYTLIVFYVTEFLMRGKVTRWLYLGSIVMTVSMIYGGSVTFVPSVPSVSSVSSL